MLFFQKHYFRAEMVARIVGGAILLATIAVAGVQAAETSLEPGLAGSALGLSKASLNLVSLSPVIENGQTVGVIAIYDDPATQRAADYIEVLNREGAVVLMSWIDPFGIERLAVDRALIDGAQELRGEFIAVLDGDII